MWYAVCAKKSGLSREIDANGKTTMDYYLLADMTVQIGYELAIAGAETYRVEETMRRVLAAYGIECGVWHGGAGVRHPELRRREFRGAKYKASDDYEACRLPWQRP